MEIYDSALVQNESLTDSITVLLVTSSDPPPPHTHTHTPPLIVQILQQPGKTVCNHPYPLEA